MITPIKPDANWYLQNIPCRDVCPVGTNANGYVQAIAQGNYREAFYLAAQNNPLVGVCAWVCGHYCEKACRLSIFNQPVAICGLKRAAVEYGYGELAEAKFQVRQGKKAAVVGAGPAGLAAFWKLRLLGYQVDVFEKEKEPGGMVYHTIPSYRLPPDILQKDLARLQRLGLSVKTGFKLGENLHLEALTKEYDGIILAIGAGVPKRLDHLPGFAESDITTGLDFLFQVNHQGLRTVGRRVAVVGGGNVAIDVGRTIRRLQKMSPDQEVYLIFPEAREEMPAWPSEVTEALREGIKLFPATLPGKLSGEKEKILSLEPVGKEKARELVVEQIIIAIGQLPEMSLVNGLSLGISGAGDFVTGPKSVVAAVASGIEAALKVHSFITGEKNTGKEKHFMLGNKDRDRVKKEEQGSRNRVPMTQLPLAKRKLGWEVELGFSPGEANCEAKRCLDCRVIPLWQEDDCLLCGGCVDVCPQDCLAIVADQWNSGADWAFLRDDTYCLRCGLCAKRCPAGAMTMVELGFDSY